MKHRYKILCLLLGGLPGCEPSNLYVAHDIVFGLNAKVDQGRQQGQVVIGYDRDFATVIPTKVPVAGPGDETDAMSLVHCTHVEVDGINLKSYRDYTATGKAAALVAADPDRVDASTKCNSPAEQGDDQ